MKVALELTRQEDGQQGVLVTVEEDGRHDAGNRSFAPDLSIEHRGRDDDSWVGVATVPGRPGLTYFCIEDLKAQVRCTAPRWFSEWSNEPPSTESDPQD